MNTCCAPPHPSQVGDGGKGMPSPVHRVTLDKRPMALKSALTAAVPPGWCSADGPQPWHWARGLSWYPGARAQGGPQEAAPCRWSTVGRSGPCGWVSPPAIRSRLPDKRRAQGPRAESAPGRPFSTFSDKKTDGQAGSSAGDEHRPPRPWHPGHSEDQASGALLLPRSRQSDEMGGASASIGRPRLGRGCDLKPGSFQKGRGE